MKQLLSEFVRMAKRHKDEPLCLSFRPFTNSGTGKLGRLFGGVRGEAVLWNRDSYFFLYHAGTTDREFRDIARELGFKLRQNANDPATTAVDYRNGVDRAPLTV